MFMTLMFYVAWNEIFIFQTYDYAINYLLSPNAVESRSLWLDLVTVVAINDTYSRHNGKAKAEHLARAIKVNKSGVDDHIVVSVL